MIIFYNVLTNKELKGVFKEIEKGYLYLQMNN